jgi:hypothetical protein
MTSRIPEPADPFEEEGLAAGEDGLPGKWITGDAQDGMVPPHDYPVAVDEYGVTAEEQALGEPLDLRLSREEPDVTAAADVPADESAGSDSPYPEDPEERVGRIVDIDEGAHTDTEKASVAYDVGTDTGGFSAEERAMHIEPEA